MNATAATTEAIAIAAHTSTAGTGERRLDERLDRQRGEHAADQAAEVARRSRC